MGSGGIEEMENFMLLTENSLEAIFDQIKEVQPELVVIDSIQTISTEDVESSAGSIAQVRECASALLRFAKTSGVPVILIGHITKEGTLAGPKILEHIVDTVIQFEGDQHYMYRILRSIKNRFGSTAELGIYEMLQNGLRQVSNPSELLLTTLLLVIRMQNIVQHAILVLLEHAITAYVLLVLNKVGHDFLLYRVAIFLSMHAEVYLLLQFGQLTATVGILQSLLYPGFHLCEEVHVQVIVNTEHPTYQGSLAHIFIATLLIHIQHGTELHEVEAVHSCQRHSADDNLLVDRINGGR